MRIISQLTQRLPNQLLVALTDALMPNQVQNVPKIAEVSQNEISCTTRKKIWDGSENLKLKKTNQLFYNNNNKILQLNC